MTLIPDQSGLVVLGEVRSLWSRNSQQPRVVPALPGKSRLGLEAQSFLMSAP